MLNPKARFSYALASICLLLALSPCATAMERAFGYSRILATGAPAPLATITVRNAGTATLSTVFSDNASTPKTNPFTADTDGYWFFYAANGRYDITLSGGGIVTPYTLSDVVILDSTAIGSICGISGSGVTMVTGTTGTDFSLNCNNATDTITYNLPSASAANRGLVTTGAQTLAGVKTFSTPIAPGSGGTGVNAATAANGNLLIGNGTGFTVAPLTAAGTGSILITNGAGSIGLDTAQDINPSSSPNFALLTLSDGLILPGETGPVIHLSSGDAVGLPMAAGQLVVGAGVGVNPVIASLGAGPGIGVSSGVGTLTVNNTASLNGMSFGTFPTQSFAVSTGGSDFGISSVGGIHTFSLPDAGITTRGVMNTGVQQFLGAKAFSSTITAAQFGGATIAGTNVNASATGVITTLVGSLGTGTGTTGPVALYVGEGQASGTAQHAQVLFEKWQGGTVAAPVTNEAHLMGDHNEEWIRGQMSELLTLSNAGATTNTANNLLPADAIIEAVVTRVTTTISGGGVTTFSVGDSTTAARFSAAAAGLTANSTRVGLAHMFGVVSTTATGPTQAAAATVRITCDATPTAGVVRITVFYRRFIAPTF